MVARLFVPNTHPAPAGRHTAHRLQAPVASAHCAGYRLSALACVADKLARVSLKSSQIKEIAVADLIAGLIRWSLRAVLLLLGVLVFLGVLGLGLLLTLVWGLRALWARLTGRPIAPWTMPLDPRAGWRNMYQRSQNAWAAPRQSSPKTDNDVTDVTEKHETYGEWPESQFSRALLEQNDVTDVQPRDPRDPQRPR